MIIETSAGQQIAINIRLSYTIREIKKKIEDEEGIPVDEQVLVFADMELEDHQTISYYGISNDDILNLIAVHYVSTQSDEFSVFIKTPADQQLTINIRPSCTIRKLKKKIEDEEGIPVDEQVLVFADMELEDDQTISYYDFGKDCIVYLIHEKRRSDVINETPDHGNTVSNISTSSTLLSAFYVACRDNDIGTLRKLVQTLPVEEMDRLESNESTGLHVACYKGHIDVVRLLLERGVSRSIMNKYQCLPYDEAASNEIKQLFERIPGNDRFVANSGKVEWLLMNSYVHETAAEKLEFTRRYGVGSFQVYGQRIVDNYIVTHFRDVKNYDLLLKFFQMGLKKNDPLYFIKAYTAETGFYARLNIELAGGANVGDIERQYFVGILAFNPCFARFRYCGTAYRGMRLTEDDLNEYKVHRKVMTKSFLSATTGRHVAEYFIGKSKRTNIHGDMVKKGVVCTYIVRNELNSLFLQGISEYPDEKEVLIFPYSIFTVTEINKISCEDEHGMVHIVLEQCDS